MKNFNFQIVLGCLWAMNPSKVGKMDEEVQKWSRKDPQAIRKAMVRPDNLEALERGEMKFCSESNSGEDYGSEEEELDVDETYLVASSPVCSPTLVHQYDDETSDVEVPYFYYYLCKIINSIISSNEIYCSVYR